MATVFNMYLSGFVQIRRWLTFAPFLNCFDRIVNIWTKLFSIMIVAAIIYAPLSTLSWLESLQVYNSNWQWKIFEG